MLPQVENMLSSNGNPVPNQFVITTEDGTLFKSYESNIVWKPKSGKIVLGRNWDYSNTTSKYRIQFLGESTAVTRKKLEQGIYEYDENL